jgi:uncharacterized protein YlxW (UPF0749 family)
MSDQPPQHATEPEHSGSPPARGGGRHELPPDEPAPEIGDLQAGGVTGRGAQGPIATRVGALAVLLCVLLGVAIVTQARQTESGDSLETARRPDLLVLLDSLQQREAALNTEVTDLQRNLAQLQASGSSDQAAIENAQARLAALSILIGTVAATGPGVTLTIEDSAPGVPAETMLDVVNELRAAGAEAMEIRGGAVAVRVGVDTWVGRHARRAVVDSATLNPPYSVLAIGDPPTLAAAMNIPRRRDGQRGARRRLDGGTTVRSRRRNRLAATETPPIRSASQMSTCPRGAP